VWNAAGGDPQRTKELSEKLEQACAEIGRDASEVRRSVQYDWDGKSADELIEQSGAFLERGITEQVIYLRGPGLEPVARAEKLAALLPDLRHNQSAESSTHRR